MGRAFSMLTAESNLCQKQKLKNWKLKLKELTNFIGYYSAEM
jgi:hypothetical protein